MFAKCWTIFLSRGLRDKLRFALLSSVVISFLFTYSLALTGGVQVVKKISVKLVVTTMMSIRMGFVVRIRIMTK